MIMIFCDIMCIITSQLLKLIVISFLKKEQSLTGSESEREKGLRVFKSHDQQGK